MTEEHAPRAPHAPQAPHRPAPADGVGAGCGRPPQGDTALRERLDAALRTVGLARNLSAYRDAVLPVVEEALAAARDEIEAVTHLLRKTEDELHEQTRTLRAVEVDRDQWRDRAHALLAALDADQPKETQHTGGNAEDCPVCRPLIDQPGGVLYPWLCTETDQPEETR